MIKGIQEHALKKKKKKKEKKMKKERKTPRDYRDSVTGYILHTMYSRALRKKRE